MIRVERSALSSYASGLLTKGRGVFLRMRRRRKSASAGVHSSMPPSVCSGAASSSDPGAASMWSCRPSIPRPERRRPNGTSTP